MQITARRLTAAALLAMTTQGAVNVFERKPSAGPAPGDCQIFAEGATELTLCLKKQAADGGDVAVLNGVLFNSGKEDICNVKVEARGTAGTIQNIWPDWATGEGEAMVFTAGQQSDLGMTVEGAGATLPTIGLVGFESCKGDAKYSEETSTLRYVSIDNVKFPNKPVEEAPKAGNAAPAQQNNNNNNNNQQQQQQNQQPKQDQQAEQPKKAEENKPAAPAQNNNNNQQEQKKAEPVNGVVDHTKPAAKASVEVVGDKIVEIVEQPLTAGPAVGECHEYTEGESGVTLCIQSAEGGVVHGFLFNQGKADLCNLKLETTGVKAPKDFWPDWAVAAPKEEMIFAPGQKTDTGFTLADGADATGASIIVTGYDICGTKAGLKKDSKAKTVAIAEVKVPEPVVAEPVVAAPAAKKPAPKLVTPVADEAAEEAAKPASTRFMRRY